MIAAVLERLFAASQVANPVQRVAAYTAVSSSIDPAAQANVISVLTEGAMRGPDAARGLAAQLGG